MITATSANCRRLGTPYCYQDGQFCRPVTPKQVKSLEFHEVEVWGGLAIVSITVEYHFDNGSLVVDDVILDGFFWCDREGQFAMEWDIAQISRWKQHRINDLLEALDADAISERLD